MIDRRTIDRIISTADIVDVVGQFVTLRRSGANLKGLCPFHDEKTPSFMVSPAKQICKCFSCGQGGNVVQFVMKHEQMNYAEALRWLGRRYGIEVQERELTPEEKAAASAREAMFVLNEWARDFFVDQLHNHSDGVAIGMAYFRKRGLRDDIIHKFQLGYSPEQRELLAQTAQAKGYNPKYIEQTGLCFKTEDGRLLDRYHGRVIFPIHSLSGRVVAFGGRIMGSEQKHVGKYVNSPESEIYSKKRELYGLYFAKQAISREDRCYLVEGYLDVISMFQAGVENVVASSGTALTTHQTRLIHRLTNNVTLIYDGDAAGIKAALRGIDILLAEGLNIKVVLLPEGEDPDSLAQRLSPEDFKRLLHEREQDFIQFKTDRLMREAQHDPSRRAEAVQDILRSISVVPSDLVRQVYIHELATRTGISEAVIVGEVSTLIRTLRQNEREQRERERQQAPPTSNTLPTAAASNATSAAPIAATRPAQPTPTATTSPAAPALPPMEMEPIFDEEGRLIGEAPVHTPASPPSSTPAVAPVPISSSLVQAVQASSPALRLRAAAEKAILELVVRYGECPIILERAKEEALVFTPPTYNEFGEIIAPAVLPQAKEPEYHPAADTPYVAPYIQAELEADEIRLSQPLYQQILDEAAEQFALGNFHARDYFTLHPNPEIAAIATALADERHELSRFQQQMYTPDHHRLEEITTRVVHDLKYAVLSAEKEQILHDLQQPEVSQQPELATSLMQRLIEINQIEVAFAKVLGDRVLGR